jgi:predicted N-acetyltransferase YhbS
MIETVPLSSIGAADVDTLLDEAFGADRHQRTAYLLRQGMSVIDHLSFAATNRAVIVGSIQCWPVAVAAAPLILVGPVAVSPALQNRGIGRMLMHTMLNATEPGDQPMVMIGDPEYYGRFGFVADETGGWTLPGPWEPRRLLLRNPQRIKLPHDGLLGPHL